MCIDATRHIVYIASFLELQGYLCFTNATKAKYPPKRGAIIVGFNDLKLWHGFCNIN
jgi:hypothetical protein